MSLVKKPVLLLNAALEPIHIITVKRALTMLTKGKVVVALATDQQVYPGVFAPSVVRLVEYKYIQPRGQQLSKKNIHLRDNHTCLYCGKKFPSNELTLDHVVPKSRGGKSSWENLVSACRGCNQEKDDQTPEEAAMPLRHRIIPSTVHMTRGLLRTVGLKVEEWSKWLFVNSAGDERFVVYG